MNELVSRPLMRKLLNLEHFCYDPADNKDEAVLSLCFFVYADLSRSTELLISKSKS